MSYLGDYATSTIVYGKFTTYRPSTGAPFTLAGTPALSVYKDNSTTQSTTGVTLTVDFDSVTGLHHFSIDTSADGTFYSAGSNFDVVITTGTVDSISAVGTVVGRFTLNKTAALRPTVAGRTLDVSSGGEAGLDWANVGSPTTTVGLSGTTISTTQAVASVSGNVGGNVTGSVGSVGTGGIASTSFATGAITATAIAADAIGASELAADAVAEIADAVWDEVLSGHLTSGTTGAGLNAAGSAGDPWSTALPGAYGAGSAGYILGTNLNATVSSRLATSGYTAPLDAAGTRSAVGLASANLDTQLTSAIADSSGVTTLLSRLTSTRAGYLDNLATSPPTVSQILTTQMTESYRATNAAPTLAQALCEVLAHMGEVSIVDTTKTLKKFDGTTTAKTFTLNSATAATSITETT